MPDEYHGLCSTCNHSPTCRSRSAHYGPVFYCEEFDSYTDVLPRVVPPPISAESEHTDQVNRYTGLCSDCKNMESCMFLEPEGGVWHCEEYR
ncbi:MAG TPA: hypothetical protein PLQ35_12640 [bacterium]|nr:hypothetical protein [bacterium]HQL63135.1 hypothetical protein [bacterium]